MSETKLKNDNRHQAFIRYAWLVVFYTVLVILWGAVVRATGSGAGCGNHWPACNGEVIPRAPSVETMIELSHRITSAFAGVLVIILLVWAYRLKPALRFVRWMAVMSFIFILIEGGIGAALVRLELVEDNASTLRAIMIAVHLANTLVLLLWVVLTAWGAGKREIKFRASPAMALGLGVAVLGFIVMSSAGAVTALGDTLFLSGALDDVTNNNPYDHFLVQLRVYHPVIAVIVSIYIFALGFALFNRSESKRVHDLTGQLMILIGVQIAVGMLNIWLQAPVWMQITHLLLADIMWILLVLLSAEALTAPQTQEEALREMNNDALPAAGD